MESADHRGEKTGHFGGNDPYSEQLTFVASVVPIERGINVANTVHSQPDSPLHIACLVPNSTSHFKFIQDPRCAEMERIFRRMARDWYSSRDVSIPNEQSDEESEQAPDLWRERRLALIRKGLAEGPL
ncbi:hypothetical protein SISSUDRAFT_1038730 [Sistotremastrum suecicum HHB10207 ss-3]|uniref:Uncharacterized protein n=1 Tax=Sistotremastrum suecicum HHB10207 ss-3 TaxID=1314776 RepID=A0A165WEF7_9AGAM|nr:hypothetical protein SISSUDRAFT_1038730 [Sistotremastrum suecicum HHB10207 ss-3]